MICSLWYGSASARRRLTRTPSLARLARLPLLSRAQFGNIVLGGKNAHREESVGVLRLHAGGIGWKSKVAGNVVPIQKADLRAAEWIKIPHAYQLKVRAKGGFVYRFNGFRGQDKETVKSYCTATFGLEVEDGALSYKGWNWGQASVEGGNIDFKVEGKPAFELPLTDIAQATAQKSEAVIEMVDDDTALDQDELLVEVRFHMPPRATGGEGADGEPDAAEAGGFVELIKQSGDLETARACLDRYLQLTVVASADPEVPIPMLYVASGGRSVPAEGGCF